MNETTASGSERTLIEILADFEELMKTASAMEEQSRLIQDKLNVLQTEIYNKLKG